MVTALLAVALAALLLGGLWLAPKRKRKRLVRLHLQSSVRLERDGTAEEAPGMTIEGVLAGTRRGHYVLWAPKVLEGPEQTVSIDGYAEVPRDRVLFYQVL